MAASNGVAEWSLLDNWGIQRPSTRHHTATTARGELSTQSSALPQPLSPKSVNVRLVATKRSADGGIPFRSQALDKTGVLVNRSGQSVRPAIDVQPSGQEHEFGGVAVRNREITRITSNHS